MRISPLKAGTVLMIIGIIWISILFVEAEKAQDSILLKQSSFFELKSKFVGTDIGYYKILIPEFVGDKIFVQILDPKNNIIQEEKIQTKISKNVCLMDGIENIELKDIKIANQLNLRIKLLGITELLNNKLFERVHPCLVGKDTYIGNINGVPIAKQNHQNSKTNCRFCTS